MLVLSRRLGEKITIGNDITIEVRKVHGNRVQLGITAPKEIKVLRDELREQIENDGHIHNESQ